MGEAEASRACGPRARGAHTAHVGWMPPEVATRLRTTEQDIRSLAEHDGYLASKISFLLDATMELINIQQNAIIKIFSVAAVVFMPPTVVASIYGMNFEHMPEL